MRGFHHNVTQRSATQAFSVSRLGDRSFDVAGPRLWNKLPASLRSSDSLCQYSWKRFCLSRTRLRRPVTLTFRRRIQILLLTYFTKTSRKEVGDGRAFLERLEPCCFSQVRKRWRRTGGIVVRCVVFGRVTESFVMITLFVILYLPLNGCLQHWFSRAKRPPFWDGFAP